MANYSLNIPYITLTGVVLIAIVVVFIVIQPQLSSISTIKDEISLTKTTLKDREDFLRTVDQKTAELQAQQIHEQRLNVILPEGKSYEDAIRIFHTSAAGSGLVINKVTDQSSAIASAINASRARGESVDVPSDITPMAAEIEVFGTYQQLRAFLERLEKTPRIMDATSLTIQKNTTSPDQITARVFVRFYFKDKTTRTDI